MTSEQRVAFRALEYHANGSLRGADYAISGSPESGWRIEREGQPHLEIGPGHRLLRTRSCGICSTDLDRHFLPFPLPQITGHELIAEDEAGRRFVVEINASHAARREAADCPFCRRGLATHCPERRVVGIHDLPGGFGPWLLAPVGGTLAVPDDVPDDAALLVEPFAAALAGVDRIAPREGDVVAVLGTRRLGQLVLAALAARRRERGVRHRIVALSRHERLRALALRLGADEAVAPPEDPTGPVADVVVDTTASPAALAQAVALAAREVHLKSTHGQPSCGLRHTTELVVDELALARRPRDGDAAALARHATGDGPPLVAWLSASAPPAGWRHHAELIATADAAAALARVSGRSDRLPRADLAVVPDAATLDAAIRPDPAREISLVRPRGEIWLDPLPELDPTDHASPLLEAIATRDLRLTSSRCGDFRQALTLLQSDPRLRDELPQLVTHHLPIEDLPHAMELARSPEAIKVVVEHD